MDINIEPVIQSCNEFNLLRKYIDATNSQSNKNNIKNIFRIQRKGEAANLLNHSSTIGNNTLLFHGSKIFNYIGIFSNGLKIAPPEAPATGYMFGKGVYFADMFSKSYSYCDFFDTVDENGKNSKHMYMLLCEVALGKEFEVSQTNQFDPELNFLKSKS